MNFRTRINCAHLRNRLRTHTDLRQSKVESHAYSIYFGLSNIISKINTGVPCYPQIQYRFLI